MAKEIVINCCYGGFGICKEFLPLLGYDFDFDVPRDDPALIELIKTLGSKAVSDNLADLTIIEIPDEATDYRVIDYDGAESVLAVVNGKIVDL